MVGESGVKSWGRSMRPLVSLVAIVVLALVSSPTASQNVGQPYDLQCADDDLACQAAARLLAEGELGNYLGDAIFVRAWASICADDNPAYRLPRAINGQQARLLSLMLLLDQDLGQLLVQDTDTFCRPLSDIGVAVSRTRDTLYLGQRGRGRSIGLGVTTIGGITMELQSILDG